MFISKEIIKENFQGTTLKNAYKKIMIFIWKTFIEAGYKPNSFNGIHIESFTIIDKSNNGENTLELKINTQFDFEEEFKRYCIICKRRGYFEQDISRDCENCKLNKFIKFEKERIDKRAKVIKNKYKLINEETQKE